MNTSRTLTLVLATLAAASFSAAALAPVAVDGAEAKSPLAACCVEIDPVEPMTPVAVAEARPLTVRSLYQLKANWTGDDDQTVSLASLRGHPVVMAMFFSSCEYACPVLVQDMQRLRAELPDEVKRETRFVLVSFDTARDTPAVLKAYRERYHLDAGWSLLRGDATVVQELAMLLGVKFKQDARGQFAHSNLITILNPEGEIAHRHPGLQGDISQAARAVVSSQIQAIGSREGR